MSEPQLIDMSDYMDGVRRGYRWSAKKSLSQIRFAYDHNRLRLAEDGPFAGKSEQWWDGYMAALSSEMTERLTRSLIGENYG